MALSYLASLIAVVGSLSLLVEGMNVATDGDVYLNNLRHLAQAESAIAPPPEPAPPPADPIPPPASQPPPAPFPSQESGSFVPTEPHPFPGEPQGGQQPFPPQQNQPPFFGQPQQQPFSGQPGGAGGQFPGSQGQFQPGPGFPGQGSKQGFPGQGPQGDGQFPAHGQPFDFEGGDGEHDEEQETYVDPREVKDALRQTQEIARQAKSILKQAQKALPGSEAVSRLTTIMSEAQQFRSAISAAQGASAQDLRDTLVEFWQTQQDWWDEVRAIEAQVRLPKEIQNIEKTLKRLEKIVNVKSAQNLGLDLDRVRTEVAEMRQTLSVAKAALQTGDYEAAHEVMQEFYERGHPGEIEGSFFRLRDMLTALKRTKDQNLRSQVEQALGEPLAEFNAGNYREARELLDERANAIFKLLNRSSKTRR